MLEPRQFGTLGGFIAAVTEMDPGLLVYAREPWSGASRAIVTSAARPGPVTVGERLVAIFGDGRPGQASPFELSSAADAPPAESELDLAFVFRVGELQALVKRLRRSGIKDHARLCEAVIASAVAQYSDPQ